MSTIINPFAQIEGGFYGGCIGECIVRLLPTVLGYCQRVKKSLHLWNLK